MSLRVHFQINICTRTIVCAHADCSSVPACTACRRFTEIFSPVKLFIKCTSTKIVRA